jgi:ribosomal protein L31E
MPAKKQIPNEREYIVNLRREILKVQYYKRTPKAVKALKQFVAKHMRVPLRDLRKVKIDKYLNQELWFKGIKSPPTKLKIKCKKDGENIIVTLVELPDKWKFVKAREDRKQEESKKTKKEIAKQEKELKKQEKQEGKQETEQEKQESEQEKKLEEEKFESGEEMDKKKANTQAKQAKHTQIDKGQKTQPKRMALQK